MLGLPIGKRSRKRITPNRVFGAGAALAAAVPVAQQAIRAAGRANDIVDQAKQVGGAIGSVKDLVSSGGEGGPPKLSHLIEEHTDIAVPRSTAYNQWTQLEMFPAIVKGVESVSQERDEKAEWTSKIGPSRRSWTARITEQVPDEKIAWVSEGGAQHRGVVTFHSLSDELTRVLVQMEYDPKGPIESVGNLLRVQRRRVRRDLRQFKHFLELRHEETGAWRGQIDDGAANGSTGTSARSPSPRQSQSGSTASTSRSRSTDSASRSRSTSSKSSRGQSSRSKSSRGQSSRSQPSRSQASRGQSSRSPSTRSSRNGSARKRAASTSTSKRGSS